jgi:hypothetical protein
MVSGRVREERVSPPNGDEYEWTIPTAVTSERFPYPRFDESVHLETPRKLVRCRFETCVRIFAVEYINSCPNSGGAAELCHARACARPRDT